MVEVVVGVVELFDDESTFGLGALPDDDSAFSFMVYSKVVNCFVEAISYGIPSIPNGIEPR
ncbi:MAG TPA: hypothetical protein VH684_06420 [Xanthobacteraceae bacterium]|jgi:hypothetical protein